MKRCRIRPRRRVVLLAVLAALSTTPACRPPEEPSPGSVVVTTSLLEQAAREVLPPETGISVVRLAAPGTCPGHFDLSPRALPRLAGAVLVIRHDFQEALDEKLSRLVPPGCDVVAAGRAGGLLVPEHYAALVDDVARRLAAALPGERSAIERRAASARSRIERLAARLRTEDRPWRGARVIASGRQRDLCSWLGLEVVATLDRPGDVTPAELERLVRESADLIVANLQEGTSAAATLGRRKGIPVAVFSNFPGADGYGEGYDALLDADLERLESAWRKRCSSSEG